MNTKLSPMLAVSDASSAIEFYKKAFGAIELWRLGNKGDIVAGLSFNGADLFLATESPQNGTRAPHVVGHTTVRIELFVDDPNEVYNRAVAAGAKEKNPVSEHSYSMAGPHPIRKMLQGALIDPFGHLWLIGKVLE